MFTYGTNNRFLRVILIITCFSLACAGCARSPFSKREAIRVGDYTLSAAEFNELFLELSSQDDTPQARRAFLENLINRKALLRQAQKEGLDKQKDFLKAIENFWEQSLLTIVIDKKVKEISGSIIVTEKEIEDYYNDMVNMSTDVPPGLDYKLRNTIRLQLLKQKQAEAIDSWAKGLRDNADIKADKKALGIE